MKELIIVGLILVVLGFFVYKHYRYLLVETDNRPVYRVLAFLITILLFPIAFPIFILCWLFDIDDARIDNYQYYDGQRYRYYEGLFDDDDGDSPFID